MKKIVVLLLAFVLMLSCCSFSVSAAGGPTVEKVTRIGEKSLMVEFSEDVVIDGCNPFMGVRYVDDNDKLQFVNGQPLQFYNFNVSVIDGRTILLDSAEGIAKQILDFTGQFAFYKDFHLKFCIEEMEPEGVDVEGDGTIYNIKSRATGLRMAAQYGSANALEGAYFEIEKDYMYVGVDKSDVDNMDDPNATPSTDEEAKPDADNNTFVKDDPAGLASDKVSVIYKEVDTTAMWAALAVSAVSMVGVIAIVVILLVKKAKKPGDKR